MSGIIEYECKKRKEKISFDRVPSRQQLKAHSKTMGDFTKHLNRFDFVWKQCLNCEHYEISHWWAQMIKLEEDVSEEFGT